MRSLKLGNRTVLEGQIETSIGCYRQSDLFLATSSAASWVLIEIGLYAPGYHVTLIGLIQSDVVSRDIRSYLGVDMYPRRKPKKIIYGNCSYNKHFPVSD